jgi:hypothetical protein
MWARVRMVGTVLLPLSPGTGVSAPSPCAGRYTRGDHASNPSWGVPIDSGGSWGHHLGIYESRAPLSAVIADWRGS